MSSKDLLLQLLEEKLLRGGCSCDMMGEGRRRRRRRTGAKSAAKVAQGKKLAKYNKLVAAGYPKKDAKKMSGLGIVGGSKSDLSKLDRIKALAELKKIETLEGRNKKTFLENYDGICSNQDPLGEYIEDPISGDCDHYSKIYKKYGRDSNNYYNPFVTYDEPEFEKSLAKAKKKQKESREKKKKAALMTKAARKLGYKPSISVDELNALLGN